MFPDLRDRHGELRITKLRKSFPRIKLIESIAHKTLFHHWELTFSDIFADQGGFDLVIGNPPWIQIQWNEGGILGERHPLFSIRGMNATEKAQRRALAFDEIQDLQKDWTIELEQAEATQSFLNGQQLYSQTENQFI